MWLLNIETRQLEYFEGRSVPSYAILSHRWTCDEVSFQDIINGDADRRKGYSKIDNFCKQVFMDDISVGHVWIDTCCIDKSSHSELSEAINSMYKWYSQARLCYAYLADVVNGDMVQFTGSIWFRRGWTLQELLAPDDVQFFDADWKILGTKRELSDIITQITGIPADALEHFDYRRSRHSVADRMSWAAQRETTREEDLAYSLLGIFGVNMPLLYGEGARAFLRLQEEILKISEDLTIFAWSKFPKFAISNDYLRDTSVHDFSLFASSPDSFDHRDHTFRNLLDVAQLSQKNLLESSVSGAGLAINLILIPFCPDVYIVPLCDALKITNQRLAPPRRMVAMFVERTKHRDRYRRIVYDGQCVIIGDPENLNLSMGRTRRVVLERAPYHAIARAARDKYGFNILHVEDDILRLFQMSSQDKLEVLKRNPVHQSLLMESGEIGVAGMLRLSRRQLPPIYFHFGFDYNFNPFCLISRPLARDGDSKEDQIIFETSIRHVIPVECSLAILHLVSLLQVDARDFNLREHNLELYVGSWEKNEMQFVGRDCRVALDLSAGHSQGYVYHVSIGLAHKHYPWASDGATKRQTSIVGDRVKWHSTPLVRQ